MKRSQIREGMVFGVPMPNESWALLQIIKKNNPTFYMAGFNQVLYSESVFLPSSLQKSKILFLGNFFDGLIVTNKWRFIGLSEVIETPFPCTRVLVNGEWLVESWDRKKNTVLPTNEAIRFPLRSEYGAALLQNALLNFHGYYPEDEYLAKNLHSIDADFIASISDKSLF